MVKRIIVVLGMGLFLLVAGKLPLAQGARVVNKPGAPKVILGFSSPESVIADARRRYFYVSNLGEKLEPGAKDSDGFISRLSPCGDILDKKYLPESGFLNSPKGMAIIKNTLFVTDVDKVLGFDLISRKQTFELDFSSEGTVFLNDLAVIDNETLVVSATDTGKVYKVFLKNKPYFSLLSENIPGTNGLYFDRGRKRIFTVSFGNGYNFDGELGIISLASGKYEKLTGPLGGLDGVCLLGRKKVIFSDWVAFDKSGLLRAYDLKTKQLSVITLSQDLNGPADFFYDKNTSLLWMPKMKEGKILIEKIGR